ncbi:MAG: hypothetical protein J6M95_00745 [Bacilli bacterium]|nr:hypothetical protein [Bacilli bacterium]
MSPNEQEIASASLVRSRYAFIFECVIQLYDFAYRKKPSKKFEEVVKATEEMHEGGKLNDYLYENLKELYKLYPTMIPGKVEEGYKKNHEAEEKRLINLSNFLSITISDLCAEINEIVERSEEFDRAMVAQMVRDGYIH